MGGHREVMLRSLRDGRKRHCASGFLGVEGLVEHRAVGTSRIADRISAGAVQCESGPGRDGVGVTVLISRFCVRM